MFRVLKFTLDTGNFAYSDEDAVQAYEVLKDYIVHVHCKDRNVDPALTGSTGTIGDFLRQQSDRAICR